MKNDISHEKSWNIFLENTISICNNKNVKLTHIRANVLRLIWESKTPIKAYDILEKMGEKAKNKPPTVYRALDFLKNNGLVHKLSTSHMYVCCTHPLNNHNANFFLICSKCSVMQECFNDTLNNILCDITSQNNFKAQSITLEINGLCGRCQGE